MTAVEALRRDIIERRDDVERSIDRLGMLGATATIRAGAASSRAFLRRWLGV